MNQTTAIQRKKKDLQFVFVYFYSPFKKKNTNKLAQQLYSPLFEMSQVFNPTALVDLSSYARLASKPLAEHRCDRYGKHSHFCTLTYLKKVTFTVPVMQSFPLCARLAFTHSVIY